MYMYINVRKLMWSTLCAIFWSTFGAYHCVVYMYFYVTVWFYWSYNISVDRVGVSSPPTAVTGSPHSQATPGSPVTSSVSSTTAAATLPNASQQNKGTVHVCVCVHMHCVFTHACAIHVFMNFSSPWLMISFHENIVGTNIFVIT